MLASFCMPVTKKFLLQSGIEEREQYFSTCWLKILYKWLIWKKEKKNTLATDSLNTFFYNILKIVKLKLNIF